MAAHEGPVLSLDVPSGVDAGSGRVEGAAVRAGVTVTYHGDMVGLWVAPGRGHAGRVVVADIGIPERVTLFEQQVDDTDVLVDPRQMRRLVNGRRG